MGLGAMPIYRFGTEEQKWFDSTSGVRRRFWSHRAGSGRPQHPQFTASLEGDSGIINARHLSPTGTDIVGHRHCGYREPLRMPRKQISTIIVPSGTPGFTVEIGLSAGTPRHPPTGHLPMRGSRENLLGARGSGYALGPSWTRPDCDCSAGHRRGAGPGADESVANADQRRRPADRRYQAIGFKIARMERAPMLPAQRTMMRRRKDAGGQALQEGGDREDDLLGGGDGRSHDAT